MIKNTQRQFITEQIIKTGSVTRNFALINYISRLSAIICDMQKDGYDFETSYVEVQTPFGTGRDYMYIPTPECLELLKEHKTK